MRGSPRTSWKVTFALALTLLALWAFVLVNVISFAYEQLGLSPGQALLLLVASLLGSRIDLPVARLKSEARVVRQAVAAFGVRYVVPVRVGGGSTLLAVNVGGALIPVGFSVWAVSRIGLWWQAAVAALAVAVIVHRLARPVAGVGIVVPALVPPLLAAVAAFAVAGAHAAPIAYAAGTYGTLVGADLTNLRRIPETGAAVASIGGAGTFDAVFLSGVVAVALAAVL